jgi:hypothetical protein
MSERHPSPSVLVSMPSMTTRPEVALPVVLGQLEGLDHFGSLLIYVAIDKRQGWDREIENG